MRSIVVVSRCLAALAALTMSGAAFSQEGQAPAAFADPAELAFEQGRWEEAISEYREILAAYPDLQAEDIEEALRYAAEAVRERELPLAAAG